MKEVKLTSNSFPTRLVSLLVAEAFLCSSVLPAWASSSVSQDHSTLRPQVARGRIFTDDSKGLESVSARDGGEKMEPLRDRANYLLTHFGGRLRTRPDDPAEALGFDEGLLERIHQFFDGETEFELARVYGGKGGKRIYIWIQRMTEAAEKMKDLAAEEGSESQGAKENARYVLHYLNLLLGIDKPPGGSDAAASDGGDRDEEGDLVARLADPSRQSSPEKRHAPIEHLTLANLNGERLRQAAETLRLQLSDEEPIGLIEVRYGSLAELERGFTNDELTRALEDLRDDPQVEVLLVTTVPDLRSETFRRLHRRLQELGVNVAPIGEMDQLSLPETETAEDGGKEESSKAEIEMAISDFFKSAWETERLRDQDMKFLPTPPSETYKLLNHLGVSGEERLLDLGSGNGALVIAASTRVREAVGVELVSARHKKALHYKAELAERGLINPNKVQLKEGNFLEEDFSKYDLIFLFKGDVREASEEALVRQLTEQMQPSAKLIVRAYYNPRFELGDWRSFRVSELENGYVAVYEKISSDGDHHPEKGEIQEAKDGGVKPLQLPARRFDVPTERITTPVLFP